MLLALLLFAAQALPPWQTGMLDIHQIHTGRGNAALFVFPDGKTMLLDAGAVPDKPGPDKSGLEMGPRRPNATRTTAQWLAAYIRRHTQKLDYAVITHYHDDHLGALADLAKQIPIATLIDRGDLPAPPPYPVVRDYLSFRRSFPHTQVFQPGLADQITSKTADFEVRNLAANGTIWTGKGTHQVIPHSAEATENDLSLALRLRYGLFDYYTGGDLAGVVLDDAAAWHDMETPLAAVIGRVDVAVLNHHGWLDTTNNTFLRALQPRVIVIPAWHASHPDHSVLRRLRSPRLGFPAPDVFITELLDAPRAVFAYLDQSFKSTQGHIVIRVAPGGRNYSVYILDSEKEEPVIKAVHGPYESR